MLGNNHAFINSTIAPDEYIVLDEWAPLPVPDGVPDEAATLTEPCAVAVRAVRNSRMKLGDTVGVIGAGPIGLLVLQAARAAGAGAVFISEPAPARARAAAELGAHTVINPTEENATDRMVELTGGIGPDVVFDCAGIRNTLDQAFDTVRRDGQVVLVAVPWEPMPLNPVDWMVGEKEFKASWGSQPDDWRRSLELMEAGKITVGPLLSESSYVPLEGIQEAFEALTSPSTQLQMIVKP